MTKSAAWEAFAKAVAPGWRVEMHEGYLEKKGTVVSLERRTDKCPRCGYELQWWYEVEVLWDGSNLPHEKEDPHLGSFTIGPDIWVLRHFVGASWAVSTTQDFIVFEPPDKEKA